MVFCNWTIKTAGKTLNEISAQYKIESVSYEKRSVMKNANRLAATFFSLFFVGLTYPAMGSDLKISDPAPTFQSKTQDGKSFDLASRKGKWTVLYFYPRAGTPGCTTQACAFRDNIEKVHAQGAEVFGISADTVEEQAAFWKEHHLNFTLLADPDDKVVNLYGSKMPVLKLSKRWTFIIDPELKIRAIEKDVDPALDAVKVAAQIADLKTKK
jgi:peroxiredoxin Q/BCP